MTDWMDDPEARAWAQRVLDDVAPKIRDSAATISIVPDVGVDDIKFAVELGLTIMLGKPLILAVTPGRQVPPNLVRVADRIIELDFTRPEQTQQRIMAAVDELTSEPPC